MEEYEREREIMDECERGKDGMIERSKGRK